MYNPRIAEDVILNALVQAAEVGSPCPTADDLSDLIGSSSVSTTVGIMQRLEKRGIIKIERYQRERRVTIVKTGAKTAQVKTPVPHWRDRPRAVPSPAFEVVRRRDPEASQALMVAARHEGRALSDFLADMVWLGFQQYRAIQSQADQV